MLALHRFLAGNFTNPFVYGISRLLMGTPPALLMAHLSGDLFWEALSMIMLAVLYWIWRIIRIAECRASRYTRKAVWTEVITACQHLPLSSVELLQSMQHVENHSVVPRSTTRQL